MYHSIAAAKRKKQRQVYLRRRNAIIYYGGIVMFGIVGIVFGLYLVKTFIPNHPWFN